MKVRDLIPVALFLAFSALLAAGLFLNPREVPSPLIDRPAPAFSLPRLDEAQPPFSPQEMQGRVWLLNVWATWCTPCREEHPVLVELARRNVVPIVGMNYKEARGEGGQTARENEMEISRQRAAAWLRRFGDPYSTVVMDVDGRVGLDYGVYGVPETYLIDGSGRIRYKHIGAITPQALEETLLPMIAELQKNG